jgi:hypothetical protein
MQGDTVPLKAVFGFITLASAVFNPPMSGFHLIGSSYLQEQGAMLPSIESPLVAGMEPFLFDISPHSSAKCKSVRKPEANLLDTPVDLTGAPK